jgi:O-antigen/teichoic acid export membrane protein/SAM-dependent methyltransferase
MTAVPLRRRLIRGSIQVLLAEGLGVPVGILAAAYLTRRLGPQGYGLFALAASFIGSLEWFVHSMLSRAAIKVLAESHDWRATAAAILRRYLAIGVPLGLACWALAGPIASWLDVPPLTSLIRLSAVQVPLIAVSGALLSTLVARGFYQTRAVSRAVRLVSRFVFILILVGVAGMGVAGAILAGILGVVAGIAIAQAPLRLRAFDRPAKLAGFWRLALAVFTTVACVRLLERLGLLLLKAFGGTVAEAGFYAAAQNFALGPGLLAMSLSPLLIAALTEAHRDGHEALARVLCHDALRVIVWMLPIAGIAAGAAHEIVTFVYGRDFGAAAPLAPYMAFAGVALAGLSIAGAILAAYDRSGVAIVATLPVLPAAVAGYFFAVPIWGGVGAAAVTMLATSLGLVATLVVMYRLLAVTTSLSTFARAAVVTALCWIAAASWATPGPLVMVKSAILAVLVVVVMLLAGDMSPGEMNLLRAAMPWGRGNRRRHRVDEPPAQYLDAFMADQKRRANLSLVERWVDLSPAGRVLKTDLFDESREGEGFLDAVAAPGRSLVGIDLSPAIVELSVARLAHAGIRGVVADVRQTPFASDTFDLVVSNSTLDHFDTTSDIDAAIHELARVIKPGGVLVITLDNPRNLTYPLLRVASALVMTPFPLGETYNVSGLSSALTRAGLEVTDTRAIIHNPRLAPTTALLLAQLLRWSALQRGVHRMQRAFERFEGTRWQYVTGCFVAARAVKPARDA